LILKSNNNYFSENAYENWFLVVLFVRTGICPLRWLCIPALYNMNDYKETIPMGAFTALNLKLLCAIQDGLMVIETVCGLLWKRLLQVSHAGHGRLLPEKGYWK